MPTYRLVEGGMHQRMLSATAEIVVFGGGYGNGKTAAACIRALTWAQEYPGSNGLIARSTYPKLNDTIRKEFMKWCPPEWIDRQPTRDFNTAILTNGTNVNFRYVQRRQQDDNGDGRSNLLSATYDWIIVDQIEDPEFSYNDFLDLVGRLRGTTPYVGDEVGKPLIGPQQMIVTLNPNRNWSYRKLVRPVHVFQRGIVDPDLIVRVGLDGRPVLDADGKVIPNIELIEGATHENVANVGEAYITRMMATYKNQSMRDRYIFGKWGALEGLVYPQFDDAIHLITQEDMREYLEQLKQAGIRVTWLHGYDHGIMSPACYLLAFADHEGNVFILDGFYEAETQITDHAKAMKLIWAKWGLLANTLPPIFADPSIFKRTQQATGPTVASLYAEEGIRMVRGANDIAGGISKVSLFLSPVPRHEHPVLGSAPAPHMYFCRELPFIENEITDYTFDKNANGDTAETPRDKNDHAMDTIKYILTNRIAPATRDQFASGRLPPELTQWQVIPEDEDSILPRNR